jgi:assimilatory nitrate reductase catalytic subunit
MTSPVRTTCPYCGVGCGVVAEACVDGRLAVRGDPQHPSNLGRLCSKGAALAETLALDERLLHPEINGERADWDVALDTVADTFSQTIRDHGPGSVAFYVSGQLLTEDYYVANKLMKGFIGTANIDTNSRLCMSSSVAGHKRAFGADVVPCSYRDLEVADLIVLVGSNTAWCHPVLYQRIQAARRENPKLKLVVIDPRRTDTCEDADLHLAIAPGTDTWLFNGLFAWLHEQGEMDASFAANHTEGLDAALAAAQVSSAAPSAVAQRCGISVTDLLGFYGLFAATEKVVTVYSQGVNQSAAGTDKVNSIINCHLLTGRIGRPGMGPFSFTGQPNAMGGREVGGLANMLAAHMDFAPADVERVQRFWHSPVIAQAPGLKAVDMFRALEEGRIKAIWIMATNPAVSLPEADRVRAALADCPFVVVSDVVRATDTSVHAHVRLPAAAWGEKSGTVTNSERRISRQRAFLRAPGEARPDWWIVTQVARRMGFADAFQYGSPQEIFVEHAALSGFENDGTRDFDISALAELDAAGYEALSPIQWPVTRRRPQGTERMLANGRFYTASGRARFIATEPRAPVNPPNAEFPFVLNTGRVRDQWHTMTRTAKAARLNAHSPEPYVEMRHEDARTLGIVDGALARIENGHGTMLARVKLSANGRRGAVFVPIHWSDQFARLARVGALVNAETDPVSGQPELKHTPVRVLPYAPRWVGFVLSRRKLPIVDASYCVSIKGEKFWRYELAGETASDDWKSWARSLLCTRQVDGRAEWLEFLDAAVGHYHGVRLFTRGDGSTALESCVFIAPAQRLLPPRSWLAELITKPAVSDGERMSLLAGVAPRGEVARGPAVCACFGVDAETIRVAIRTRNLVSVEAIGQACRAGTNCGSCIPELKSLLEEVRDTRSAA